MAFAACDCACGSPCRWPMRWPCRQPPRPLHQMFLFPFKVRQQLIRHLGGEQERETINNRFTAVPGRKGIILSENVILVAWEQKPSWPADSVSLENFRVLIADPFAIRFSLECAQIINSQVLYLFCPVFDDTTISLLGRSLFKHCSNMDAAEWSWVHLPKFVANAL